MHQYGVRDVEKLLGLPRSTIRALIKAGFVTPAARAAQCVAVFVPGSDRAAHRAGARPLRCVPHRRITKSLKELRRNLPEEMPLSGLRIAAVGDHVVVKEGDARWQAETGQYLLAFEGDPAAGSLNVIEQMPTRAAPRHRAERAPDADDALEQRDTRCRDRSVPASDRDRSRAPRRAHESRAPSARKRPPRPKPSRSIATR